MPLLPFISDKSLETHISKVIEIGIQANQNRNKKFHSNVIDPFSPIFELTIHDITAEQWEENEKNRQIQKTLQNAIGDFHNDILGSVHGWQKLEKGNEIDLIKSDLKIIAEIKNKHNTVSGGKLVAHYDEFDDLVNNKASKYYKATAYYVKIIPKNKNPFNKPFVPSDKKKGMTRAPNDRIREIDGRSFYGLVTGIDDALDKLHAAIPVAIKNLKNKQFTNSDLDHLNDYFQKAYL